MDREFVDRRDTARRQDALKLKILRAQIQAGLDDLDQGNFDEVEDRDLDAYLERLSRTSPRAR